MRATLVSSISSVVITLWSAGCTSPAAPSAFDMSKRETTEHFVFRMSAADSVDTAWQEAYHVWAVATLQVTVPKPITYNKYLSRVHMGDVTGNANTNAYAYAEGGAFEIHTIWPTDNHEVVHLYSSTFGRTVALFSEGLAVAFQINAPAGETVAKWSGTPLHDWARTFRQQGRLAAIASIVETSGFRALDANVTYPESGSFVRFLIDTYGLDPLKRLYGATRPTDTSAAVESAFAAAYGFTLAEAEARWLAMLGSS